MRVISLNVNGIRSADRRGLPDWLARGAALGRRLPAGDQGHDRRRAGAHARAASRMLGVPPCRAQGVCGRRAVRPRRGHRRARLRQRRVRPRRPLPRSRLRSAGDRQRLPAIRIVGPAPAGVQVPLPRSASFRISRSCAAAARRSSCAATGTSRTSRSTSGTGAATRGTPDSSRRSAPGSRASSTRSASSTCSGASIRGPSNTRGGRIAARPGRRTSAGASTTRSQRPAFAACARAARRSTRHKRFSDHAPLIVDYDFDLGA